MFEGWGAAIVGAAVVGGVVSSNASSKASKAQQSSAQQGIDAENYRFDQATQILKPYVEAGAGSNGPTFNAKAYLAANPDVAASDYWSQRPEEHWQKFGQFDGHTPTFDAPVKGSLQAQQDMLGLNGVDAQRASIDNIKNGPQFAALTQQGEEGILQNASATGGLRGGNTQGALAQFRPQLLSALITDQYNKLGGLTQIGQASAAGQATAGLQNGQDIAGLLAAQGQAKAGKALADGKAINSAVNSFGTYASGKVF
jgi:hypothetical protein